MASNPSNVSATFPVLPPVFNLPFGRVQDDGQVYLTPAGMQLWQEIWASVQGSGGLVDQSTLTDSAPAASIGEISRRIGEAQLTRSPSTAARDAQRAADQTALGQLQRLDPRLAHAVRDAVLMAARPPIPPRPVAAQVYINPPVSTFAGLPGSPADGARAFITDGSVVAAGNFGTVAAGSGTNHAPVYYDAGSSAWRIG